MAVKKGYKQTEVGLIPEDWDVVALGRMIRSVEYGSSSKSSPNGAIPVLRMGNLQSGKIDWTDLVYTDDELEIKRYSLRRGDVLFNRTNTIDLVGKSAIYEDERPAIFAGYLIRINALPGVLDTRYLNYILNTEFSRKHSAKVLSIAVGQANINGQKLKTYPIPTPPTLAEQEAIAGALSDADAWIESLEQLIAKKRQVKQGAMQELLTGKRRLPGFSGEWETRRLGDVLRVRHGKSQSEVAVENGCYPILASGGEIGRTNTAIYSGPSVLIGRKGTIDAPRYSDSPFWSVDTLFFTEIHTEHCAKWLYYRFCLVQWRTYNEASGVPSLNARTIEAIELVLPELKEQIAIATVLSDMDQEIESLESKLAKAREVKQGMMQELLTGRIRLV